MKKVLCGLVIALMMTGSGYTQSTIEKIINDKPITEYEERNWQAEAPLWPYPEPKIRMCSLIHQKITTSLRNLYLDDMSNLPISGDKLDDAYIYATVYNAVCK